MKTTHHFQKALPTEYPFLAVSKSNGAIVLFTDSQKGVCVHSGGMSQLGDYSTTWSMQAFEPMTGQLTLENN
jgi:hypothetical protein